jgi:hypothetical protein
MPDELRAKVDAVSPVSAAEGAPSRRVRWPLMPPFPPTSTHETCRHLTAATPPHSRAGDTARGGGGPGAGPGSRSGPRRGGHDGALGGHDAADGGRPPAEPGRGAGVGRCVSSAPVHFISDHPRDTNRRGGGGGMKLTLTRVARRAAHARRLRRTQRAGQARDR